VTFRDDAPVGDVIREERRVVTALFADLVGSTALAERLDPEEVKLVVGEAVARIVHAVEAFGGTVKDLAGDGVLALFGAPVSHEDDAERALHTAFRVVEEIRAYAQDVERGWGIGSFGVRVGVDTGEVAVGAIGAGSRVELAAVGDPVNTAARLQAAAQPGEILVTTAVRDGIGELVVWGSRTELELKGKAEPVTAFPAMELAAEGRSGRGVPGVTTPFVGRERELEEGRETVRAVMAGSGSVLVIVGEPGIGKSRLLDELRRELEETPAPARPATWLEGRCVSYGESMPYWPFRDLLRSWLGSSLDEPELRTRVTLRRQLERLFGPAAAEVYPYLGAVLGISLEPEAGERLSELSPEALQFRTFEVIRELVARIAEAGPVVLAIEDLHWADATSLQLLDRMLGDTDRVAVLLVLVHRREPDHPSWHLRESAARTVPHRTREIDLVPLSGDAEHELLHALVGGETLPREMERRILEVAEGNPFFLEEIVRSLVDHGALVRADDGWRFEHAVPVDVPPTVEKVILARADRLTPADRDVLAAAAVLGRQFSLPLLEGVVEDRQVAPALTELQRLDLVRQERRWPEPEFRFKHALIQDAVYRTITAADRERLHRRAALWLEETYAGRRDEVAGLLAHHWLAARDEDKAVEYLTLAGDRARQEYALDEAVERYRQLLPILERRGERQAIALVCFKLALALHMSLRFGEANETYQRAFDAWTPPRADGAVPSATLRISTSFLPNDPDPRSAIAWPNIQLCMQLFDRLVEAWPERTIVPSLAERWEIAEDGLRYVFHLREGLRWSDGVPLTAHDVEFGIKRVLNPEAPGSSVAIYFVLEHGQDHYLRRTRDADAIGVRALDDRTLEFRLAAPAPYFMSVMNRPDAAPLPRHAIERDGDTWAQPDRQVVSGPFGVAERTEDLLALERRRDDVGARTGNVARVELVRSSVADAMEPFERGELDLVTVRYTPRMADLTRGTAEATVGPAAWSYYLAFDHAHPATSNRDLRAALAHGVDRAALGEAMPANLIVANGGIVPPALQGHTPDIVRRFDPDLARELLVRSGFSGALRMGGFHEWEPILRAVIGSWERILGLEVDFETWDLREYQALAEPWTRWQVYPSGWLPGYADPEYFLRLLLHSESRTNEGRFRHPPFDDLIERARQERSDRARLDLFHQADRMAVVEQVALIPLAYGRSMAFVQPWVQGWWEFGKSSASFADLVVDPASPRA
jgi:ABC-type oligopeptide transport system substrate-binding subunit/class 3 adenylate cyclase